jgi:hypothetical protein
MKTSQTLFSLFLGLILSHTTLQAQSLSDGLVGWWTFTNNALDSSGKGNHGTVYGATLTKDRFDHDNRAYQFDGVGSYINFGTDASLKPIDHSVVFWFRYTDSSKTQMMLNNANSLNGEWGVNCWYVAGYGLRYNMGAGANDHVSFVQNPRSFADGKWHMYAVTYSETTDKMSMYIDGAFYSNQNGSGTKGGVGSSEHVQFNSNEPWIAGASSQFLTSTPNSGPNYFRGDLDDIRIYNRAITASEVQQLYSMLSSVEVIQSAPRIDIFPNPTLGLINIHLTDETKLGKIQFRIYTPSGQILYDEPISNHRSTIDLKALGTGRVYILKLTDEEGIIHLVKSVILQ